jgi:ankyrin repeat protein
VSPSRTKVAIGALLFAIGAPVDARAQDLIAAARSGDVASVQRSLGSGIPVDTRAVDGTTALHWAVRNEHDELVAFLLEAGADPSAQDRYGTTPLYLAAVNGDGTAISHLLEAGTDPNAIAADGDTALMTAARTGLVEPLARLIDAGAKVDSTDEDFGQTALMLAVREGHVPAVEFLIEHGASVDARTRVGPIAGFTPPCKGTGCGSEGVGINRGGLPDRGRRDAARGGMTPLLYAARDGRFEGARALVEAAADVELAEANGIRPLLMSILNDNLDVAYLLLDAGADPNADDFWGRTPLWAAVEYRNLDMNNRVEDSPTTNGVDRASLFDLIVRLIREGADVNARTREVPPRRPWLYSLGDVSWVDFTGQTPFLRAALSGDVDVMRLLLEHGADPNLPTQAGTTPLMAAAGVNWVVAQTYTVSNEALMDAIDLCLDRGADVNATNSMGLSALLGAVNRGSNEIIEQLVAAGADLQVVDVEGRDALRWAEGVFLASVGAERKPETIALLERLMNDEASR